MKHKCVVCGAEFDGEVCPVCKFQVIHFPGDEEEGLRSLKPQIEVFRRNALERLSVGIITYTWKGMGDNVVLDKEERLEVAVASALKNEPTWLNTQFARDPQSDCLDICLSLRMGDREMRRNLTVPNLKEQQLQQLGVSMDEGKNLKLHLRNGSSESHSAPSPVYPLFS